MKAPPAVASGGDDDKPDVSAIAHKTKDAQSSSRTRKGLFDDPEFEFLPQSLIGSWFHRLEHDQVIWQGLVVGQPANDTYLVQIDTLAPGVQNVQRLVKFEAMCSDDDGWDWRFYDSKDKAQAAYVAWATAERKDLA